MAASSENKIGDFDLDEVINWDDHNYASKGLEFGELPPGLEEHVADTAQPVSQTAQATHQENLLLGNSVLTPRSAVATPREPRTSMVSMPQVSQQSRMSSLFGGSQSALIQGNLLHAPRSGSFSTPSFPSENFDLPPITPPASGHAPPSIFSSLDHQMATGRAQRMMTSPLVTGNINTASNIQANVPPFSQPNLAPPLGNIAVDQHLGPPIDEVMEEGSIDKIIDEIVDRDMPQGVSAPIVFTRQVAQNLNASNITSGNIQQVSSSMQQSVAPPRSSSPAHRPSHLDMNQHVKQSSPMGMQQAGSPLNMNPLNQNPGSPHRPTRTPSPQVAVGQNLQKISLASPVGQRQTVTQGRALPLSETSLSQIQTRGVTAQKVSPEKLNVSLTVSSLPVQSISNVQQMMAQTPQSVVQGSPLSSVSQPSSSLQRNVNNNPQIPLHQSQTKNVTLHIPQSQSLVSQPNILQNTSFPTVISQSVLSATTQASKPQTLASAGILAQASLHHNVSTSLTSSSAGVAKAATFANVLQPGTSPGTVQAVKNNIQLQMQGKAAGTGALTQAQAMQLVRAVAPNGSGQVVVTQTTTASGTKQLIYYVMPKGTTNTQVQNSSNVPTAAAKQVKMIVINNPNLQQKGAAATAVAGQPITVLTTAAVSQTRNTTTLRKSATPPTAQPMPITSLQSTIPVKSAANTQQSVASMVMSQLNQSSTGGQLITTMGQPAFQLNNAQPTVSHAPLTRVMSLGVQNSNSTDMSAGMKTGTPAVVMHNSPMGQQSATSLVANRTNMAGLQVKNSNPVNTLSTTPLTGYPLQSTTPKTQNSAVQITFVNEATAISKVKVVSTPPSTLSWQTSSASLLLASLNTTTSTQALPTPIVTASAATMSPYAGQDSDDEDSTPLALLRKIANEQDELMPLSQLKKNTNVDDVDPASPSVVPVVDKPVKVEEKKRKKKTKKKKKEGEPAKPPSPYQIFFKETQATIREQNASAQFGDIANTLSQMWENLSEEQKKPYQSKHGEAYIEYKIALEQFKGKQKLVDQLGEPSAKQRKLESTSTTKLGALSASVSSIIPANQPTESSVVATPPASTLTTAAAGTKVPKNTQSTTAKNVTTTASGKPVATVPPMASVKKTSTTESGTFVKPKKSKVTINPISKRLCIRDGCTMPARTTKERGTHYCSHDCIVKHCKIIFNQWVSGRRGEAR